MAMTQEQVARRARVSAATVSRVLHNKAAVSSAARARVMKAVEELKYSPNLDARGLAAGSSRSVGVIVSNFENPFFLDIYKAVEAGAGIAGFDITMANTGYSPERLTASVRLMIGRRVAGLAAIVSEMVPGLIEELNGYRIPTVFYGVVAPGSNSVNIRVNYRRGMEKLVAYLHSLGHRRLGFVGHHTLGPTNERQRAMLDAVGRYSDLRVETAADEDTLEGGRRAAGMVLAADPAITAVICANDLMALGALRALRDRGLRVPHDISVTGFDNIKLAQFSDPSLTSVDISREEIGRIICDCLFGPTTLIEREFVIDPELVLRDSTGPAAPEL